MHFKRILLILIVMIFMTGTLSAEATAIEKSAGALEPWTNEVVDKITVGYVGSHISIAHYKENGRAYVSYYDATNHDLKLAYQVNPGTGNCPGNLDWKCSTVDNGGPYLVQHDVGQFNSIDIITETVYLTASPQGEINAQPPHYHYAKIGISYYDNTDNALKFAIGSCNDATVCSWTKTTVDDDSTPLFADNIGQYSSFKFGTDAVPIIYYHVGESLSPVGLVKHAYLPTRAHFRAIVVRVGPVRLSLVLPLPQPTAPTFPRMAVELSFMTRQPRHWYTDTRLGT